MKQLNLSVFGYNTHPFAEYMEPDGLQSLPRKRVLRLEEYLKSVPEVCRLGQGILARVDTRSRHGVQLSDGDWRYEIFGRKSTDKKGKTFRGKQMGLLHIVKALCGKSYAVGTTNIFDVVPWYDEDGDTWGYNYHPVSTLRIDVDTQLRVWNFEMDGVLKRQWETESSLASLFGFGYYIFKTGNRGHQSVMPLPCKVNHSVAWFLMMCLLDCLSEQADSTYVERIKDHNLNSIMRLPFGLHAKSGALGLFVDTASFALYGIEEQAAVFERAFSTLDRTAPAALNAIEELTQYYSQIGVQQFTPISRDIFSRTLLEMKGNWFVDRYLEYCGKSAKGIMTGSCTATT